MNKKRDEKGRFIKGVNYSPATEFKKGQHWRKEKAHWDRGWLDNKYTHEKMSASEIAELQGCTENAILYWLDKHNIETRSMKEIRSIKHWGNKGKSNGMYGVTGEDNPNWKGGLTPDRQAFYISQEWKQVCPSVWERDNATCQRCGIKKNDDIDFHVHHIVSFQIKELRAELENLVLLCKDCHRWVHSNDNTERLFIKEVKGAN